MGLARALLSQAMAELDGRGAGGGTEASDSGVLPSLAYIVDGNSASERCFEALGWRRVASADWLGFRRTERGGAETP